MSNQHYFIIEDNELRHYRGSGGDVTVPEGVTRISSGAFKDIRNVTSVTLPDSVRSIRSFAFAGCESLQSIVLPESVTSIGNSAFSRCSSLQSITLPEGYSGEILRNTFADCRSLQSIVLPAGVISLDDGAFRGCISLELVVLPQALQRVGVGIFEGTSQLGVRVREWTPLITKAVKGCQVKRVFTDDISKVPAGYRFAAALGFVSENPPDLTSESVANYMSYLKRNTGKLSVQAVENPELLRFLVSNRMLKARDIDSYIEEANRQGNAETMAALLDYQNQLGLDKVGKVRKKKEQDRETVLDRSVQRAGRTEEDGISGLTFVINGPLTHGGGIKSAKRYLEGYGAKLDSAVTLKTDYLVEDAAHGDPEQVKKARELGIEVITEEEFNEMVGRRFRNAEEVRVPVWIREICPRAFYDCTNLRSIILPDGLTQIGEEAFAGCVQLQSITIPKHVSHIGEKAFAGCVGLRIVELPESLVSMGNKAFGGCASLEAIEIPKGMDKVSRTAFIGCVNLKDILLPEGATWADEPEGSWRVNPDDFVIESGVLKKYVGPGGDVVVPEGVASIGRSAFDGCEKLTGVTLPESLESIEEMAFYLCTGLRSIVLPGRVTRIGPGAFLRCGQLTNVTLPQSLVTVENNVLFKQPFSNVYELSVRVWSPAVTQAMKGNHLKVLHTDDISKVPAAHRAAAVVGFVSEGPDDLTTERAENHISYLKKNAGKMAGAAMEYPELLVFLLEHRLLKAKDFDAFITEASARHDEEMASALRDVQSEINEELSDTEETKTAQAISSIKAKLSGGNRHDFVLENGMLKKYVGPGGDVVVPEGVKDIDNYAFMKCVELRSVSLSEGVRSIGYGAFSHCAALESVRLPESMEDVGEWAFNQCSNLTELSIPEHTKVGYAAFAGCKGLADENGMVIVNGILFDYACPKGVAAEDVTGIIIPEGVKEIIRNPFYECRNLNCVELPFGLETLEEGLFEDVTELRVRDWSPVVSRAVKALAPEAAAEDRLQRIFTEDISKVPSAYRPAAVLGFISDSAENISAERAENHMAYLKRNAGKLSELAVKHPGLLYFLLEHKVLKPKDMDAFTMEANRQGNAEVMAALLSYQNELGATKVSRAREKKEEKREQVFDRKLERTVRKPEEGISGLTFVVTGKLRKWNSRKEVKEYLECRGAKLGSGVTGKTDYLVTNDAETNSEKAKNARELGVEVISEDQFNAMVGK